MAKAIQTPILYQGLILPDYGLAHIADAHSPLSLWDYGLTILNLCKHTPVFNMRTINLLQVCRYPALYLLKL